MFPVVNDAMIDAETLGTKAGCVILSIGAAMYSLNGSGHIGGTFYCNIDPEDCKRHGLTVDPETVAWWDKQSEQARAHLLENRLPLFDALLLFLQWWSNNRAEKFWCQGAGFDAPIMEAAFNAVGLSAPWKFWNVRDTRTAYDILDFNPYSLKRGGTYHNALDDALHQIRCVQTAFEAFPPHK